jgi:hypothetical protein
MSLLLPEVGDDSMLDVNVQECLFKLLNYRTILVYVEDCSSEEETDSNQINLTCSAMTGGRGRTGRGACYK